MKATIENQPAAFQPRSITITFESQKELDGFATIANAAPLNDAFRDRFGFTLYPLIYDQLISLGADRLTNTGKLCEALKTELEANY